MDLEQIDHSNREITAPRRGAITAQVIRALPQGKYPDEKRGEMKWQEY